VASGQVRSSSEARLARVEDKLELLLQEVERLQDAQTGRRSLSSSGRSGNGRSGSSPRRGGASLSGS